MMSDRALLWYEKLCERDDPMIQPLRVALNFWLASWNLQASWIVDTALRTIRVWEMSPGVAESTGWYPGRLRIEQDAARPSGRHVTLDLPSAFDLLDRTVSDLRRRLRHVLDLHLATIETEAKVGKESTIGHDATIGTRAILGNTVTIAAFYLVGPDSVIPGFATIPSPP